MRKIKGLFILIMVITILSNTFYVNATTEKYNLAISYNFQNKTFPDINLALYKVADTDTTGKYVFERQFKNSKIDLNNIQTQEKWDRVSRTLESYVLSQKIPATRTTKTNSNGKAKFNNLEKGLFLIPSVTIIKNEKKYIFSSFMVYVNKNLTMKPKCETKEITDKLIEHEITIKWEDMDNNDKRPEKVIVHIYKDKDLYESVILNKDNNWSYQWTSKDDGSEWSVVQSKTPQEYNHTIEKKGNKFIITNRYSKGGGSSTTDTPLSPQTGDYTNLWGYVAMMSISGVALLLLALLMKSRNSHSKKI